jgi:hypothetical protein
MGKVKWAKHSDLKLRREQHVMRIKNYIKKQKLLKELLDPNPQLKWIKEENEER